MNTISVQQPHAAALFSGQDPVRYLAWQTYHRGPLLIHAAKPKRERGPHDPDQDVVSNAIIGVVELADCVPGDNPGADPDEGDFYWVLINPRLFVSPFPVAGRVGMFQVSDAAVAAELARAKAPPHRKGQAVAKN